MSRSSSYQPFDEIIESDHPKIELKWEYLTYTASTYNSKTKQTTQTELLHSTSGIARPGDFVAIMGPSGAGKTTLMNILSQKIRSSATASVGGCVYANGTPISELVYTNYIAYVTQEDILLDTMTVREAITFSVKLRTELNRNRIEEKVDKILKELSLMDVQHSLIGSVLIRGISGGEKKRVCIAVEMVTDPSVLFLDGNRYIEPTSGLDSFTAEAVVSLIGDLASTGRTVLCTIHQPNSVIFHTFDKLILLTEGYVVYQGYAKDSLKYFETIGYPCPELRNPADHYMEIIHFTNRNEKTEEEMAKLNLFIEKRSEFQMNSIDIYAHEASKYAVVPLSSSKLSRKRGILYQFSCCLLRDLRNLRRSPNITKIKFTVIMFSAFVCSCVYNDLGNSDLSDVSNRIAYLNYCIMSMIFSQVQPLLSVCNKYTVPLSRSVFMKDYDQNMYSSIVFFVSRNIVEFINEVCTVLLFINATYWIMRFDFNFLKYTRFCKIYIALVILFTQMAGTSMGLLLGSIFSNIEVANALAGIIMFPFIYFSGFYRDIDELPPVIDLLTYISPNRYAYFAAIKNEYEDMHPDCYDEALKITDPTSYCNPYHGVSGDIWSNLTYLFLISMGIRIVAYFCLLFKAKRYVKGH